MARLNLRPSSLSGAPQAHANSAGSDQENRDPNAQQRRDSGKSRATDMSSRTSLLTPSSEDHDVARGQKRKRVVHAPLTQADDIASDMDDDEARDEAKFNRYFDPDQDPEQRRLIKRKSRAIEREFNETRDELLRGDGGAIRDTISRANNVFRNIKQTNDATLDSRLFVNVSDLAYKKTAQLVLTDSHTGLDVEEFLRKCMTYLRNGDRASEAPTQTQRRRTHCRDEEDDDDDDSEPLDWEMFGRHACFPYNSRPACPSFLLGPLSIEKKIRKQTQRSARQTRDTMAKESRPEALTKDDLSQSDANALTSICKRISDNLRQHCEQKQAAFGRQFSSPAEMKTPQGKAWMKRHHITSVGGPHLFDYVINPNSFGQTIENIFYISFLIKEGHCGISADEDGLPALTSAVPMDIAQKRIHNTTTHQAVFSLDYATWEKLIEAFDIHETMIPHRQEHSQTQVGERGWYT